MTGQGGMAVLLIIALTKVTSVTGAGPIPLTPEEEAQRDNATAAMADLPPEDQMELPAGPVAPIPACECHAHGDVRYVTCDGEIFRYNTLPTDIGIMAKPNMSWLWYVQTEHEFFSGKKTRLAGVKLKVFSYYAKIEYKKTTNKDGLFRIEVGKESDPDNPIWEKEINLNLGAVLPLELFNKFGLKISIIEKDGKPTIEVRSTILPAVLFEFKIHVLRHCLQITIPPIWSGFMEGICGDWDGNPGNDVVILDSWPQVMPIPFRGFP